MYLENEIIFELTTEGATYIGILQIIVEWESTKDIQFCEVSFGSQKEVQDSFSGWGIPTPKRKKKTEPEYKENFFNKRSQS